MQVGETVGGAGKERLRCEGSVRGDEARVFATAKPDDAHFWIAYVGAPTEGPGDHRGVHASDGPEADGVEAFVAVQGVGAGVPPSCEEQGPEDVSGWYGWPRSGPRG